MKLQFKFYLTKEQEDIILSEIEKAEKLTDETDLWGSVFFQTVRVDRTGPVFAKGAYIQEPYACRISDIMDECDHNNRIHSDAAKDAFQVDKEGRDK